MMENLEREQFRDMWQHLLQFNLAQLQNTEDALTRKKHYDNITKLIERIRDNEFPWIKEETVKPSGDTAVYQQLYKQWCDIWGDPNDPVVKARIEKTAQWLQNNAKRANRT